MFWAVSRHRPPARGIDTWYASHGHTRIKLLYYRHMLDSINRESFNLFNVPSKPNLAVSASDDY